MEKPSIYSETKDDTSFRVFHELMLHKVQEILLVSSPYDAFILEEDGSIASRIVTEYNGLNLSKPPRLTQVSTGASALSLLNTHKYDLVITTPFVSDMDALSLGEKIKTIKPQQSVFLLASSLQQASYDPEVLKQKGIDDLFLWTGSTDLFLAIIKNYEDHLNVHHDTETAMVRVLLLVEDSPVFRSSMLPTLYKIIVQQTQSVLDESLNEEHRLLKMRARPKILTASSYEEAVKIYERYQKYIYGVISDTKYFKNEILNENAGFELLRSIRAKAPNLPLLLLSSSPLNRERGEALPAVFLDKNDADILKKIQTFFLEHLGFGDFIFRTPDGIEVGRAHDFISFEKELATIPDQSLLYHAQQNHFSTWIMARSEIGLASWFHKIKISDFSHIGDLRKYLCTSIHELQKYRQKGVIATFDREHYDPEIMDFVKIGKGSMGGKARGLAFMNSLLRKNAKIFDSYPDVVIRIPKTCVISEDAYNSFVEDHKLYYVCGGTDSIIAQRFLKASLPTWLCDDLRTFLLKVNCPLAVRSSSLLEDSIFRPYAGLYKTYMLANNSKDFEARFLQLEQAVKLVFASSFFEGPRSYSKNVGQNRTDSMSVIIQELVGKRHGEFFYPSVSGVAQSYNYYPVGSMKPNDGLVHMALGFGKTVVEGEQAVQFSPRNPAVIPQFSSVEETLQTSQRYFYALNLANEIPRLCVQEDSFCLSKRDISDATDEYPLQMLTSTFIPEENRIRDIQKSGPKVVTFSRLLKFKDYPLSNVICDFLELGRKGLGCDVEIEFSLNLAQDKEKAEFHFLQIRPIVVGGEHSDVRISAEDKRRSFCYSTAALGFGQRMELSDIIYVNPETFSSLTCLDIAAEISMLNGRLRQKENKYLLIGPGRWGSADRFLGIPVKWQDISSVGAIVELRTEEMNAEPSQGSHFFQNITSLGIPYLPINEKNQEEMVDWKFLGNLPIAKKTKYLTHCQVPEKYVLKIDGKRSEAAIFPEK